MAGLDDLAGLSNFNDSAILNLNTTPFSGILGTVAKKNPETDLKMITPIIV